MKRLIVIFLTLSLLLGLCAIPVSAAKDASADLVEAKGVTGSYYYYSDADGMPESAHNYDNYTDVSWYIVREGATSISVTFSSDTQLENGYDYIEIYDCTDSLVGTYTYDQLMGETVAVSGDVMRIRLDTDGSVTYYGFRVVDIYTDGGTDFTPYRDTVLLLDNSVSMEGAPLDALKTAAKDFCQAMLAGGTGNRIALVIYDTELVNVCNFTSNIYLLENAINAMDGDGSWTNIGAAVDKADELLSNTDAIIKNMVILTDGLPTYGYAESTGRYDYDDIDTYYSYTGHYVYEFANGLYQNVSELKDDYNIFSFGFFHNMYDYEREFGVRLLNDLQNAGYYEVTDPDDLEYVFGQAAGDLSATKHTFEFTGQLKKDNVSGQCYYSDGYFLSDPDIYNSHLATMSLCFELTTWSKSDNSGAEWTTIVDGSTNARAQNAYNLLVGELDFDDFMVSDDWAAAPTKDSIGAVAANKVLPDGSLLIALGIRGGGYGQEWASNFTIGKEGEHKGFSEAKDEVLRFIKQYIDKYKINGAVKLWIVGYSRAGCVANMVGGEINNGYSLVGNESAITVDHEDLFVYTFEAAQGEESVDTAIGNHTNIHNIVNLNDLVPLVAPSSWGFDRYSLDRWLPSAATTYKFDDLQEKMLNHFRSFENYDADGDGHPDYYIKEYGKHYNINIDFWSVFPGGNPFIEIEEFDVPTELILAETLGFLVDGVVGDRNTYYYDFQSGVREILALANGGTLSDLVSDGMTVDDIIDKLMEELTVERILDIVSPMFAFNFDSYEVRKDKVKEKVEDFVKDIFEDSDLAGTVLFVADLKDTLTDTLWRLLETAVDDLWNKDTKSIQSVINAATMFKGIGNAHFPEVTLSWLMALDSFYEPGQTDLTVHSSRVVHINCPVDVMVYCTTTDELVASFVDDVAQKIEGSSIYAYVNPDGEKMVILPADAEYRIEIVATDDGTLDYTVDEVIWGTGVNTRIQYYSNIDISEGDVLNGSVPAFSKYEQSNLLPNGSSVTYTLTDDYDNVIAPNTVLRGEEASDAVYTVNVSADNNFGSVFGGGEYSYGSFAEVEVIPAEDAVFDGWFANGVFVSDQLSYRFAVTEDMELEARFGINYLIGDANLDGIVDSLDAATILKYDAGLITLSDLALLCADVSWNGVVDSLDAAMILKFDAYILANLPQCPLYGLNADGTYFRAGEEQTITFTVNGGIPYGLVELYDQYDNYLGVMKDDGTDGDNRAGDGVYTCVTTVTYYVDGLYSNICFYCIGDGDVSELLYLTFLSNESGSLSGRVCTAYDFATPIQNARVQVYGGVSLYTTVYTDVNGLYSINLPDGYYKVVISADGYIPFVSYAEIENGYDTYLETFLLIEESADETGIAGGTVKNSLTGVGEAGVTLMFVENWNNTDAHADVIATVDTDSYGEYEIELPLGNYTVVAVKEDYTTSYFNIVVQAGYTYNQDGVITPIFVDGDLGDNYLITLTWDANPRDLDSHVRGTLSNGNEFHVFYADKYEYDGDTEVCNLDYDDTSGYGPEHITLVPTTGEAYYYYIYRYAGSGYVSTSGAKVTVERGNRIIATFNVPTDLGTGDYWNIFAIKNGELIIENSITNSYDCSYAD